MASIPVHDTAFIIAYYRAQHEGISKDPYAKLWLRPSLRTFASDFAAQVSEFDELLHCLRNRYFLESLTELTSEGNWLFLNIGAGFSMYPYLLPETVTTIEVDLPEIISYKETAVKKFTSEGSLPKRNVSHRAVDITDPHQLEIFKKNTISGYSNLRTVILIEGVFFFLNKTDISNLFSFAENFQKPGDIIMSVSFEDSIQSEAVFARLKTYFTTHLQAAVNPFTTFPHSYYESVPGYSLQDKSSSFALGRTLNALPRDLKETQLLNEFFYTLHRD